MGSTEELDVQDDRQQLDYDGPLHANSAMLRKLDELFPKFMDLERCLKNLEIALKNGALYLRKPL